MRPIDPAFGEVVFTTNHTGYQETFTDPSYIGQIVVMTAPMIGNYGINSFDQESQRPQIAGVVVRELARTASSWRATGGLGDWLDGSGVPVLEGVDTRRLTRHIRERGDHRTRLEPRVPVGLPPCRSAPERPVLRHGSCECDTITMKPIHLAFLVLTMVFAAGMVSPATSADEALQPPIADAEQEASDDYDPWQRFNEKMFSFNHDILDRYLLKPVATGWGKILPDVGKRGLDRAFDNLGMPKRLVNNLLQGRVRGAGRELARFGVNTTVGVVGFLDVARGQLHIEKSEADTGQTLGVYGFGPGPYLVLPTLPPLTVRDGIGYGVDGVLDPFGYATPFLAAMGMSIVKQVNERALNLDVFQDVEDSVLDLYSAVRNGYLQKRRRSIEEADAARQAEWHPPSQAVAAR